MSAFHLLEMCVQWTVVCTATRTDIMLSSLAEGSLLELMSEPKRGSSQSFMLN